ncbi:MAG: 4Fe-4S dicluster domain-containing protein [Archaeoglobaceae archaeon]|nr:4Fe-4S dicluster domain-containing protein [Archaeoglobaceae archaeon]
MNRRDFLKMIAGLIPAIAIFRSQGTGSSEKSYAMVVDVSKCIGCGKCVVACKIENDVPMDSKLSRTWIEGYSVDIGASIKEIKVRKEVLSTSKNPFLEKSWIEGTKGKKTFYVPKLCNHCANAPCIEVCPVYARFHTKDGVVLVDKDTCIGCKYCIVACPYGATFLHPKEKVTDKCTFCYHRIKKGMTPVCVLLCPTEARNFGKLEEGSKVQEMIKKNMTLVLKPEEGTFPRVFYLNLDMVVDL